MMIFSDTIPFLHASNFRGFAPFQYAIDVSWNPSDTPLGGSGETLQNTGDDLCSSVSKQMTGDMMELEKIREFLVFYNYLNFTSASKALNLTQSTLSKHISDLEGELNVKLVERGDATKKNYLTPAGKVFIEQAQALIDGYDTMVRECRNAADNAPLARIHSLYFALDISGQIREALDRQMSNGGSERHFIYEKVSVDIRDALDQGIVDFAIHYEPDDQMVEFATPEMRSTYGWIALHSEPMCLMVNAAHPLAGRTDVTLDDTDRFEIVNERLASYRSWYDVLTKEYQRRGHELHFKLVPGGPREGECFYLGTRDICLCTKRYMEYYRSLGLENVAQLDMLDFDFNIQPFLVYRLDNTNPHVRTIISAFTAE